MYTLDGAKKNVVKKEVFDPARPDPVQSYVSEYKDGLLSAQSIFESDGALRTRRELSYDTSGRLAQETMLDAKGKAQSGSAYSYDAEGRKAEWRALDDSGSIKAVSDYSYGASGLGGVDMKDSSGKVTGRIKLEYANGKLSRRSYFGADGLLQKYEAFAYENGQVSSLEHHQGDGSLVSRTVYSYGSSGELVKAAEYGASGAAGQYTTYEYAVREDSRVETYYE